MSEALHSLREEYLTSIGPQCKDNSPAHITDAVNEAYKSQLKSNHQFGKGIAHELNIIETITDKGFKSINNKLALDDAKMSALEGTCGDLKKKVGTLETTISNLSTNQEKMVALVRE